MFPSTFVDVLARSNPVVTTIPDMLPGGFHRQAIWRSLPNLTPTAATFLGLRLGRGVILRISALLALRSIVSLVHLPIDSSVLNYVWSFLFSSVQASVALAAAATYLDWGGFLGFIGSRLFAPTDAPFVDLYAAIVMLSGPLASILESAIVTFELMRISRKLEARMFAVQNIGGGHGWWYSILSLSALCLILTSQIAYVLHVMCPNLLHLVILSLMLGFLSVSFISDDGNVLEGASLSLYCAILILLGYSEEFGTPSIAFHILARYAKTQPSHSITLFGSMYDTRSKETGAMILAFTSLLLLISLARAPRLLRTILIGADALKREEEQKEITERASHPSSSETPDQEQSAPDPFLPLVQTEWWIPLLNAFSVITVTFRFLVWAGEVHQGEYYPLLCRVVQAIAALTFYICYLRADEIQKRQNTPVPVPQRDIAGNVIPE